MLIRVKLFAAARDLAGGGELEIELPAGASVFALRGELSKRIPNLAPLLSLCQVAIDSRYATNGEIIDSGSEVAIIPPVSGG